MRIACPNCEAAYDVPTDRLGPGRTVRCARCSTAWTPEIPPTPPAPDPGHAADPAPPSAAADLVSPIMPVAEPAAAFAVLPGPVQSEPIDRAALEPTSAARPSSRLLLLGAWVVSLGILAGVGWAAVAYRETVVHGWLPSERVYDALGPAARPVAPPATSQ